jgi:hypothetical protein
MVSEVQKESALTVVRFFKTRRAFSNYVLMPRDESSLGQGQGRALASDIFKLYSSLAMHLSNTPFSAYTYPSGNLSPSTFGKGDPIGLERSANDVCLLRSRCQKSGWPTM